MAIIRGAAASKIIDDVPTAGIGHNNPPVTEIAADEIVAALATHDEKIEALIRSADRAVAIDKDTAGKCADLAKMIKARAKAVDEDRDRIKRPYLEAGRSIDAAAKAVINRLETAAAEVLGKLNAYIAEERVKADAERRRREEHERAERERLAAEQASGECVGGHVEAATPPPADYQTAPRVVGDYGAKTVATKKYTPIITDVRALPDDVLNSERVRDAITAVVSGMRRSGIKTITGVEWKEEETINVR